MKGSNKDEIRQIAYNCRKATFLIEKKQLSKITVREKLELKMHLLGCGVCRIFEAQSIQINLMVQHLFNAVPHSKTSLDNEFKEALQERIEKKLNRR